MNSLSINKILSLKILLIELSDPLLSVYFMSLWNRMTNVPFLLQLQRSGIHFHLTLNRQYQYIFLISATLTFAFTLTGFF